MRVLIIGPGRIGCGYLAPLFASAGWEITLAARSALAAKRIERAGGFRVRLTETKVALPRYPGLPPAGREIEVGEIRAVGLDAERLVRSAAEADLVCTAVGVGNVAALGPPLARALAARPASRPLDVWVVENDECAGVLEQSVRDAARAGGFRLPPLGFAGGVAKVTVARGSWRDDGRPVFVGDGAREMLIDGSGLITSWPELPGVRPTTNYRARLHEKLYVFNAGHAVCAYLGWLSGHRTMDSAVLDPSLRPMIVGTLLESRRALLRAYPALGADLHGPVAEALLRFSDPELADPVVRVARDPIRKLGPRDRLLGPVRLIRETTPHVPAYFALGIAGALLFRGEEGGQVAELRHRLSRFGVMAVLQEVCGLEEADPFARAVAERYRGFVFADGATIFPPVHSPEALVDVHGFEPVEVLG